MDAFLDKFGKILINLQQQSQKTNKDSALIDIQNLETTVNDLCSFIDVNIKEKFTKQVINAEANRQQIANVVRCLLVCTYRNVISAVLRLIGCLSFVKSAIPNELLSNGSFTLISYQLEMKNGSNYFQLLSQILPLFENHAAIINRTLIMSICSQLTSLKNETRYLVYHVIQVLLQKQTQHYQLIYEQIMTKSISCEMVDDMMLIVNILAQIYQEPLFREYLQNNRLLSQKLMCFLDKPEEIQQNQIEEKKQEKTERPEIIQNKISKVEQKISILEKLVSTIKQQVTEIDDTIEQKRKELMVQKEFCKQYQQLMIDEQKNLTSTNTEENEQTKKFQKACQLFQESEIKYGQCQSEIQILQNKKKLKIQDQDHYNCQIFEQQTEMQQLTQQMKKSCESRESVHNSMDSTKEIQIIAKKSYEYRSTKGAKFQKLEYVSQLISCMSKDIECLTYLCQQDFGISLLFTQLCESELSPQLFCFYDLLSDILLCNIQFRQRIDELVEGKKNVQQRQVNSIFGYYSNTMIPTSAHSFSDFEDINDTIRWLYANNEMKQNMKHIIVSSFHGYSDGISAIFQYIGYIIRQLVSCGIIEFLLIQAQQEDQSQIMVAKLMLSQVLTYMEVIEPIQYFSIENQFQLSQYNNKQLKNEMIKQKMQRYWINSDNNKKYIKNLFLELNGIKLQIRQFNTELYQKSNIEHVRRDKKFYAFEEFGTEKAPLLWEWEKIFDSLREKEILLSDFVQNSIFSFIDGTLKQSKHTYDRPFSLYHPVHNQVAQNENIYDVMVAEADKHYCLFTLPKCQESVRICEICYDFFCILLLSVEGLKKLMQSKFLQMFQNVIASISDQRKQVGNFMSIKDNIIPFLGKILGVSEGIKWLHDQKIISDVVLPIVYNPQYNHIAKLLIQSTPLSAQYISEKFQKSCICGQKCNATGQNEEILGIIHGGAISTADSKLRYCFANHIGVLLKSRKYCIEKYKVNSVCMCLCQGCLHQNVKFSHILTKQAEFDAISYLISLINDVLPEIAMISLTILEEFITEKMCIERPNLLKHLNLKNWANFGQFIKSKILSFSVSPPIADNELQQLFDPIKLYQWCHNFEKRQFQSLNRCITLKTKDIMYDKVMPQINKLSADCYYLQIDHYAFDNTTSPHLTPAGRGVLGLKDEFIKDPILTGTFTQDKLLSFENIPHSITNTQYYPRQPAFITVFFAPQYREQILNLNIIQMLKDRIQITADRGRTSFRGALLSLATGLTVLYEKERDERFLDVFESLALYCDVCRTKFLAEVCVTLMANNIQIKTYFENRGWQFTSIRSRDRIGLLAHHTNVENKRNDAYLSQSMSSSSYIFKVEKDSVFDVSQILDAQTRSTLGGEIAPASECENSYINKVRQDEDFQEPERYLQITSVNNCGQQKGIICSVEEKFATYMAEYNFSQAPDQKERIRSEKSADFVFRLNQISQQIKAEQLAFLSFKQRENYDGYDLALYDALHNIIKEDEYERQSGFQILNQLAQAQYKASPLTTIFALWFISRFDVGVEARTLINQLLTIDGAILEIFDSLQQCPQCQDKQVIM